MDYMPDLSPSSCSDETLIGTPESPEKCLIDGLNNFKPFGTLIPAEDFIPQTNLKIPVRPQFRRRNAISNQSSNDDTIVCHGPLYGAVFGNVSGGAGNLTFESSYFSLKKQKQQQESAPSSPSIAYYLSPTYGLPENPFESTLSQQKQEQSTETKEKEVTADVPDDVRSAFSSDESSENEERIVSPRVRKTRNSTLIRSPATFSLSTLLSNAPIPPIRSNDEQYSLSAPCGINLIKANKKFFDAIQAANNNNNNEEDKENFKLILPGEKLENNSTFKQRKRQTSQRITLQQVALQAGHIASLRRNAGVASR